MKIPKNKSDIGRIHQLVGIAVFVLLYGLLAYFGKDKFYWESTQMLFRYSSDYFLETWSSLWMNSFGAFYINQFLLQFFIFSYWGALIVVGLYFVIYATIKRLLIKQGFSTVFSHYSMLAFLTGLSVWMFLPTFSFNLLVPMIFFYGAIAIYLNFDKNSSKRLFFCFIMLWILPFFVGCWTIGFGVLVAIRELKQLSAKGGLWICLGILVSIFLPPYIWQHTIFTKTYINILTTAPYFSPISKTSFVWPVIASPFILLLGTFFYPSLGSRIKNWVGYSIFGIVFLLSSFIGLTDKNLKLLSLYYRVEREVEHKDWASALSTCDRYLDLVEHDEDKGMYYSWIVDNTKFALCHTGRLLEDFFSYSKHPGFGILFPQALETPDNSHPGVYNFYSAIGLQSEAIHSAFIRVLAQGDAPLTIDNLIKSHIIFGDYRPCIEFINKFDESLFYRKRAKAYRRLLDDTASINADPFYFKQRQLLPKYDFQTSWNVDLNIMQLCLSNRSNQRAFEYVLALGLSSQQHNNIVPGIDTLLNDFTYTHIPRHLEEALLIHLNYGTDPNMTQQKVLNLRFAGLRIRPETINCCDDFINYLNKYGQNQTSFKAIQERFGDTYWFHYLFVQLKPIELRGQPTYDIN